MDLGKEYMNYEDQNGVEIKVGDFFLDFCDPSLEDKNNKPQMFLIRSLSELDSWFVSCWGMLQVVRLENPYLEKIRPDISKLNISEIISEKFIREEGFHENRHDLVTRYSWAIPNNEALYAIYELKKPIIEIGAGNGYWAYLLFQLSVDVVAFDNLLTGNHYLAGEPFFNVQIGSYEKLLDSEYKDHVLMLCWPPYDDPFALNCLNAYCGNTLIFIGEGAGGCNACENFYDELYRSWDRVKVIHIPQWYGLHDQLNIYKRKNIKWV